MISIFTIGHSTQPIGHLLSLLEQHGIELLVDVRSFPSSRRHPQFNRPALATALAGAGVGYEFLGRQLGGKQRAEPAEFASGVDRLIDLARSQRVAIMCAEEDPDECHRRLLITPALLDRGVDVWHIRGTGSLEREQPGLFARAAP